MPVIVSGVCRVGDPRTAAHGICCRLHGCGYKSLAMTYAAAKEALYDHDHYGHPEVFGLPPRVVGSDT